jgi:CheY-like chemotaxis protein
MCADFMARIRHPYARMLKVLVVDDDAMVVRALKRGLSALDVTGETDPRKAVSQILERDDAWDRYDVVVCDGNMPELKGEDVLRAVRGCREPPLFILATGREELSDAERGADAVLTKPFECRELRKVIEQIVGSRPERPTRRIASH